MLKILRWSFVLIYFLKLVKIVFALRANTTLWWAIIFNSHFVFNNPQLGLLKEFYLILNFD